MQVRRPDWIFDGSEIPDPEGRGERAVGFLKSLGHPKGPEGKFVLPAFWERIVRRIYGPSDKTGARQVKLAFCLLPRGARKTTIGAGLSLLHTFGYERVPEGQSLVGASAEDQAAIAFGEAVSIIRHTPWLEPHAKINESTFRLEHPKSASVFRAISSDGGAQLGKTPQFVLADELIAWKNRELWKALRTGLVKVPDSLMIVITQAGRGQDNLAWELLDYARKVDDGEIDNPGFLPVLFEADSKADWRSEKLWYAVNPGLADGFPDIGGLRQLAREAENMPAERDVFKQFHLNMWQEQSASPFVDMEVYDKGAQPIDLDSLREQPCWLGVDLSSTSDLTAIVAAWRLEEGYAVHPWFFCPADNLERRADRDRVPYPRWEQEGHIIATPGNVVDYTAVESKVRELCEEFDVREIAFDPYLARAMINALQADNLPVVEFRQGWITMAPAVKEVERALLAGRLQHGGHPILRWHFSNVATEVDKAGNKSFHKGKSRDRIDGAVATAMAIARAQAGEAEGSWWDSEEAESGLLVL
jgi:phage terminase large subunit-like protein